MDTTKEGRLVEKLGLANPDDNLLKSLSERCEVLASIRRWELNRANAQSLVFDLICGLRHAGLIEYDHEHFTKAEAGIRSLIQNASPEEVREIYDIFVTSVRKHNPNAKEVLYGRLLNAYVSALREFDGYTKDVGFLNRVVKPQFLGEPFIEGKDIAWMVDKAPKDTLEGVSTLFLAELKTEGVTRSELEDMTQKVEVQWAKLHRLHEDLNEQGSALGYTRDQTLAEIVFRYNFSGFTSEAWLEEGNQRVKVYGGALLMSAFDSRTGLMPEFSDHEIRKGDFRYGTLVKAKKTATQRLRRYLHGEGNERARYESHFTRGNLETDKAAFRRIKEANTDIPIRSDFKFSHCCHGTIVFGYFLNANIRPLYEQGTLETRLPAFTKAISDMRHNYD